MAEPRWRDIAGRSACSSRGRATRSPTSPACGSGTPRRRAASAPGVTVVAPPGAARAGRRRRRSTGSASSTAKLEIDERGQIETPVYLCGTHAVGTVHQAAIARLRRGPEDVVIPVVGECDDGEMADSRTVTAGDVERGARARSGEEVAEGGVGCRHGDDLLRLPRRHRHRFAPRRRAHRRACCCCATSATASTWTCSDAARAGARPAGPDGSCIAVCATDAPLSAQQLRRLALRPLLGLARAGSYAQEGSGEIGVAFSTRPSAAGCRSSELNELFAAAYEAAHEAVLNCLVAARPARRLDGIDAGGVPDRARPRAGPSARTGVSRREATRPSERAAF